MVHFLDSIAFFLVYLFVNLLTTGFNIVFFIHRKKDNSATLLKLLIFILLAISIAIFMLNSSSFLDLTSESSRTTEEVWISNISIFLLVFSAVMFIYSISISDDDIVDLEKPSIFKSRKGKIKIGRVMKNNRKKHKFLLSLKDLEGHMFVCGATGTGKSNFLQHFLINFKKRYKIPFLLVEFKGEYHFLQKKIKDLLIIRPGENFSINIFKPLDSLPEVHAERIFDILKSGRFLEDQAEYSPQMEKVLVEILTIACRNKRYQSWKGFYELCHKYAKKKKEEIPMLNQTIISITNRIRRFSLGSLKALFDTEHNIKIEKLFERNILIDLSSIIRLGGEKEDALFFLNMILKYLWDKNLTRGAFNFKGIKHITIVEDTQYFAPKDLTRKNKLTTYLEDIALLQRGTGECLISLATHPDISQEILANCGVLICFKTHMDKEFLCKLLNMDIKHEDYLSILEEGQCIVRVNSIKRPFLLNVPLIKREWLETFQIKDNNEMILQKLDTLDKKNKQKFNKRSLDFVKKFNENRGLYLRRIKDRYENAMRNKKKKHQNKKENLNLYSSLNSEENLGGASDYYEDYFLSEDRIEDSSNSDEAFESLKMYIKELYKKQEDAKKL
ncbi:MAG: ATP-binding protein [Promethearchaeota archaeon]